MQVFLISYLKGHLINIGKKAAEEAARLEAERLAEEAAAEVAAEVARLEAERVAAEAAAVAAAEEAAAKAAEEAAIAAAEEEAFIRANRVAAEANAMKDERSVETDETEGSCCKRDQETEISGLIRQLINWLISIFKK